VSRGAPPAPPHGPWTRRGRALRFTAEAAAGLTGPEWLRRRRAEAFDEFESLPLPSEKEEVWRYSPIDSLDLDGFFPSAAGAEPPEGFVAEVAAEVAPHSAVVAVVGGRPASVSRPGLPESVVISGLAAAAPDRSVLGEVLAGGDALVRLNDAFLPDALVVDVPAGVVVEAPIVVVHWLGGTGAPAWFPRTVVRVGEGGRAAVVEVLAGPAGRSLVVPVTELSVGDEGTLSHVSLQVLGDETWHIGRLAARAGRAARLATFSVGLGAAYDRSRTDAAADGPGAHCELRSVHLGTGDQVHDVRTMQDHRAPRTTSDLLSKGAVAGASRSVYSGLIRVRRGAVRTEAFQTNHNLVLDARAHADSVPNLDIEENDVRCSHASTVGPVDEDQRYYLESRGVPPERAERLIVLGFFDDIVERCPVPEATGRLRREVGSRLVGALVHDNPGGGGGG
jgi:Fe-S cluster assembly protein SufD